MKMVIIGPVILAFISGFSTLLGLLVLYIKFKRVEKSTIYFLSISFSMMILISVFELMPSAIKLIINEYNYIYGSIIIILTLLLGYNFTIFIDKFIKNNKSSLYKIGIKNTIVLIVHNILEGVAVYASSYNDIKVGLKLFLAVLLHNITEGISICIPIYNAGGKKKIAFYYTLIASVCEPIGALLSFLILRGEYNQIIYSYILLFVSGLMISISINDILKEIFKYNNYKLILYGIITSIIIFIIIL